MISMNKILEVRAVPLALTNFGSRAAWWLAHVCLPMLGSDVTVRALLSAA